MFRVSQYAVILSVLSCTGAGTLSADPYYNSYGYPYPYPPAYAEPYPAPVVAPPVATFQPQINVLPGAQVYVVTPNAPIIPRPRYAPARPVGWFYARPANCGEYMYWNGRVCLDARYYPPFPFDR